MGSSLDSVTTFYGSMVGIDRALSDKSRVGGFIGMSRSNMAVEFGSQNLKIDSIFGGVYVGQHFGNNALDLSLTVGSLNFDSARSYIDIRFPDGQVTGKAEYSGMFFNPQITYTKTLSTKWGIDIIPSWRTGYTVISIDRFEEVGAEDKLSVESRTLHLFQSRLQVAANYLTENKKWGTEGFIGIDGRVNMGTDKVDISVIGVSGSRHPGGENKVVKGFGGLNLLYNVTDLAAIKVGFEGGAGLDQSVYGTGNIKIEYTF